MGCDYDDEIDVELWIELVDPKTFSSFVRWTRASSGLSPSCFGPVLHQKGMGTEVSKWVLLVVVDRWDEVMLAEVVPAWYRLDHAESRRGMS